MNQRLNKYGRTLEKAIEKNKNPDATTENLKDTAANDPGYKRLDLVSNLIDKLEGPLESEKK